MLRTTVGNAVEKLTGRRLIAPRTVVDRRAATDTIAGAGQLSQEEAQRLGQLVAESDPERPIVEIGTLFGWSTQVICLFKRPGQRVVTVDNYSWNPLRLSPEEHFDVTSRRLAWVCQRQNVSLLRMDKLEFYRSYNGPPPAIVFCDADHGLDATLQDLTWAHDVRADVVCGDDYRPEFPGVVAAVDSFGGPIRLTDGLFELHP